MKYNIFLCTIKCILYLLIFSYFVERGCAVSCYICSSIAFEMGTYSILQTEYPIIISGKTRFIVLIHLFYSGNFDRSFILVDADFPCFFLK